MLKCTKKYSFVKETNYTSKKFCLMKTLLSTRKKDHLEGVTK